MNERVATPAPTPAPALNCSTFGDLGLVLGEIHRECQAGNAEMTEVINDTKKVPFPNQHQISAVAKLRSLVSALDAGDFEGLPSSVLGPVRRSALELGRSYEAMISMMGTGRQDTGAAQPYIKAAEALKTFDEEIRRFSTLCTQACPDFPSQCSPRLNIIF